jgi:hypothetical protein
VALVSVMDKIRHEILAACAFRLRLDCMWFWISRLG